MKVVRLDPRIEALARESVYIWILWNEEEQAWEKVAAIVITHPLLTVVINSFLEMGNEVMARAIIAMGLWWFYHGPKWSDDQGEVSDIWKRSRIIKIDDHPEMVNWKVSKLMYEEYGYVYDNQSIPTFIM
jgi:hypothetical protein